MTRDHIPFSSRQTGTLYGFVSSLAHPFLQRMVRLEPWMQRAVPVLIILFLGSLAIMAFMQARTTRDAVIADSASDLEIIASVVAHSVNEKMQGISSGDELTKLLAGIMPTRAMIKGREIFITDIEGKILAVYPGNLLHKANLTEHMGAAQPLTTFAEKAGAMRIALADGTEVLATVHSLQAPFGQVALVHPLENVLEEWHDAIMRAGLLLFSTALVLSVIAGAYYWQTIRSHDADMTTLRIRGRIDTALTRGHCGLWDWDLARGRIYWSDSMYELLGLVPQSQFISFGELVARIHPSDIDFALLAEKLAGREITSIDHTFRILNGADEWTWLRARAELVCDHDESSSPKGNSPEDHLVGIAVDVTEQKLLAERTETADLRLRDAIETISEAFVLWDAHNHLVMCNSKFQNLHALPNEAIIAGRKYEDVMGVSSPPIIETSVTLGDISHATGARTYEARLSDGRWLQINERRTKDGGYVSVGTDITALKQHESQLMDSERRLMATVADLRRSRHALELKTKQLGNMAERYLEQKSEAESASLAKTKFLANMSHELRTPLNAIIGFSEVMKEQALGPLGSPHYIGYSNDIHRSGQQLFAMISDVLDMSSLETGSKKLEPVEFAVDEVVANAMQEFLPIAQEKGLSLQAEQLPCLKITSDRPALEKVLKILLRNAVKFTPEGGKVIIRVRLVADALNLYVEDTGIGIPAHALKRITRPFEQMATTMENGMKGSGLGLAIAHSLLDMQGGSLRIRSQVGAGTIVLVHLPKKPARAQHYAFVDEVA